MSKARLLHYIASRINSDLDVGHVCFQREGDPDDGRRVFISEDGETFALHLLRVYPSRLEN